MSVFSHYEIVHGPETFKHEKCIDAARRAVRLNAVGEHTVEAYVVFEDMRYCVHVVDNVYLTFAAMLDARHCVEGRVS